MASIYSTRFALLTSSAAGPTVLYTVPANTVAVIRDISGLCSAAPGACAVAINGAESIFSALALASLQSFHYEGRAVVNAGETIDLFVLAGTVQIAISGYLLSA